MAQRGQADTSGLWGAIFLAAAVVVALFIIDPFGGDEPMAAPDLPGLFLGTDEVPVVAYWNDEVINAEADEVLAEIVLNNEPADGAPFAREALEAEDGSETADTAPHGHLDHAGAKKKLKRQAAAIAATR